MSGALLVAGLLVLVAGPVGAANVTIINFEYSPQTVEIPVGDSVTWTNADSTEHTATADDGSFDSGDLSLGESFTHRFDVPGTYTYFCVPHQFMTGSVIVIGPDTTAPPETTSPPETTAPPETTSPSDTTAPPETTQPPADTTTPPETTQAPGDTVPTTAANSTTSAPDTSQAPFTTAAPITTAGSPGGPVTSPATTGAAAPRIAIPVEEDVPAGLAWVAVIAAAAVLAAQMAGLGQPSPLLVARGLAIAATLASGAIHFALRLDLRYPEPVGTMFYAQAAAAAVVAALLLIDHPFTALAAVAFHASSLGAFWISRTRTLFGFSERGWNPSPEAALAVVAEVVALVALVVLLAWRRHSPGTPTMAVPPAAPPASPVEK